MKTVKNGKKEGAGDFIKGTIDIENTGKEIAQDNTSNIVRKKRGSLIFATAFLCAVLLLTGCGNVVKEEAAQPNPTTSDVSQSDIGEEDETVQTSQTANDVSQSDIGVEKAKEVALDHAKLSVDTVSFTKAKLDYEDGVPEYELEFVSDGIKYKYDIKAADGTIMEYSHKLVDMLPSSTTNDTISLDAAKEKALTHAGFSSDQVTFTKGKLDSDDGISEYEIEFVVDGMEYEYTIDAASGTITECEVERK